MAERDFKGVWIPKEVWLDDRLSATEKVILAEIDSLDRGTVGCTAGNEYLAEFCQCSVPTVTRAIKKLTDLGYLGIKSFDGRRREISSLLIRQPNQNDEADTSKRLAINIDNNTDINIKKEKKTNFDKIIESFTDNEELQEALRGFIAHRKTIKKPLSDHSLRLSLKRLVSLSDAEDLQIAIVNQAVERGWQGFYPLKDDYEPAQQRPAPRKEQPKQPTGVHFEQEREHNYDDDDSLFFDPAGGNV